MKINSRIFIYIFNELSRRLDQNLGACYITTKIDSHCLLKHDLRWSYWKG